MLSEEFEHFQVLWLVVIHYVYIYLTGLSSILSQGLLHLPPMGNHLFCPSLFWLLSPYLLGVSLVFSGSRFGSGLFAIQLLPRGTIPPAGGPSLGSFLGPCAASSHEEPSPPFPGPSKVGFVCTYAERLGAGSPWEEHHVGPKMGLFSGLFRGVHFQPPR